MVEAGGGIEDWRHGNRGAHETNERHFDFNILLLALVVLPILGRRSNLLICCNSFFVSPLVKSNIPTGVGNKLCVFNLMLPLFLFV